MRQYGYVHSEFGDKGRVIRVTNNNPDGPGSLYAALRATGQRVVIFERAGVFPAGPDGVAYFGIPQGDVSVYGQTAPGPVYIAGGLRIASHDILFQHVTVIGQRTAADECVGLLGNRRGIPTENIAFDHCTFLRGYSKAVQTWTAEPGEDMSGLGGVCDVTFQDCIFAEPLLGPKGDSRRLFIFQEHTYRGAVLRCLFAGGDCRNPALQEDLSALIANNLVHDAGTESIHTIRTNGVGPTDAVIVNNVIRTGPNTQTGVQCGDCILINRCHPGSRVYMSGNVAPRVAVVHSPEAIVTASPPLTIPVPLLTADLVPEYVLQNAGATPWAREWRAARVIERVWANLGYRCDTDAAWDAIPAERPLKGPDGDVGEWLAQFEPQLPPPPVDLGPVRERVTVALAGLAEMDNAVLDHAQVQRLRLAQVVNELKVAQEEMGVT